MLNDADAVRALLREHGLFAAEEPIAVTFLSGGVSSIVAQADGNANRVVLKQALPQLKVQDRWQSRVERSLIEARCAQVLTELVPGAVPVPLAVDEERKAFVMACAPEGSTTWKAQLMAGNIDMRTAADAGQLLGKIHARSAHRPNLAQTFADRSFFDELRLDPYLRTVAHRHPDLSGPITELVEVLLGVHTCLVHGDYSPKNLLVRPNGDLLLLDHEVAHWGNPAFDTAFVLNHLCLKALKFPARAPAYLSAAQALWVAYRAQLPRRGCDLAEQTARVLGGLLLARVDGKSPVEYLETAAERNRVRSLARDLIRDRIADVETVFERVLQAADA